MRNVLLFGVLGVFLQFAGVDVAAAAKQNTHENKKSVKLFSLLTFKQIARLEHSQRVKYTRQLRRMALDIEKAQFMFRDSLFADSHLKNSEDQNYLYASLFGQFAGAQDSKSRRCIYAYNLSQYPCDKPAECGDKRIPFECEIPKDAKCVGSNGPGVRCGYYLSGLSGNVGRACIENKYRFKATAQCDTVRDTLSKDNKIKIDDIIKKTRSHFNVTNSAPEPKLKKSEMTNEKSAKILKELADNAYDDTVYSELIYILSIYKKNNITPPLASLDEQYASIDPSKFEKNIDTLQSAMNQVFKDYINHCERKLSDKEVSQLRSKDWQNQVEKEKGQIAHILEAKRKKYADNIYKISKADGSNADYRIDNVVEKDECRSIYVRRDSIAANLKKIVGSYPEYSDDVPEGEKPIPTAPPAEPPPAVKPPVEIDDNEISESTVTPTGCSSNVTAYESQLHHTAARCMVCLAERNKAKSAKSPTDAKNYYSVSTKWLSLLSTMVLACGDGKFDQTHIDTNAMIQYMQTFGHCSADTYDWDPTNDLSAEERDKIKLWANRDFWLGKSKKGTVEPDSDKDFMNVYGIKYETATRLFCDPDRYEQGGRRGKIKKLDSGYKTPPQKRQMYARRQQFEEMIPRLAVWPPSLKEDSVADALVKCIKESKDTANDLYSGKNNYGTCVKPVSFNEDYKPAFAKMVNEVKSQTGTTVLFDTGTCFVAKQYEKLKDTKTGGVKENIGFVIPTGRNPYQKLSFYTSGTGVADKTAFPNHENDKRPALSGSDDLKSYSFTVTDEELCEAAGQGSAAAAKSAETRGLSK